MFRLIHFLPRRWWSFAAWRRWKEYVHWRLETYGFFYPTPKKRSSALWPLLRQFPSYYRWLGEMERLRR